MGEKKKPLITMQSIRDFSCRAKLYIALGLLLAVATNASNAAAGSKAEGNAEGTRDLAALADKTKGGYFGLALGTIIAIVVIVLSCMLYCCMLKCCCGLQIRWMLFLYRTVFGEEPECLQEKRGRGYSRRSGRVSRV